MEQNTFSRSCVGQNAICTIHPHRSNVNFPVKVHQGFLLYKHKFDSKQLWPKKIKNSSYSGGMYPNVPTRRVGMDEFPTSVSLVNPKSATCNMNSRNVLWSFHQISMATWEANNLMVSITKMKKALPFHGSFCLSIYLLIWYRDECTRVPYVHEYIQVLLLNPTQFAPL